MRPRRGPELVLGLLLCGVFVAGCEREADRPERARPPVTAEPPAPDTLPPPEPEEAVVGYDERVAIYMEASPREIERAAAGEPATEFAMTTDDLMIYRATASEILERHGLPVVRVVGRRPLHFRVGGELRRYAFESEPALDLVVLYEPGKEPLALSPVDIAADPSVVGAFYGMALH